MMQPEDRGLLQCWNALTWLCPEAVPQETSVDDPRLNKAERESKYKSMSGTGSVERRGPLKHLGLQSLRQPMRQAQVL